MVDSPDEQAPSSATSKMLGAFQALPRELGLTTLYRAPADTKILILQRFVRLFAYGGSTLILASYLSDLGVSDARIGLFMTLTLVGDVFISFLLTLVADQLGRRYILVLGAALMSVAGVVFGLSGNYWVLLAGAIVGVISPRFVGITQNLSVYQTEAKLTRSVAMKSVHSVPLKNRLLPISPPVPTGATSTRGIHSSAPRPPRSASSVAGGSSPS
jgi:hypothetical protein